MNLLKDYYIEQNIEALGALFLSLMIALAGWNGTNTNIYLLC